MLCIMVNNTGILVVTILLLNMSFNISEEFFEWHARVELLAEKYNNIDKFRHIMRTLLSIMVCLALAGCSGNAPTTMTSPAGYDLNHPRKILLSEKLNEISGIRYDSASNLLVAINDEEGKLYKLNMEGKLVEKGIKFAKKGDFEELDADGSYWYAVKSNGDVYRIRNAFTDSMVTKEFPFQETGVEFETICYDRSKQKIFILTKTPKQLLEGKIAAYVLDTATGKFSFAPEYSPDSAALTQVSGNPKLFCKPTSAAFHPLTGELFVLSVNDRMLAVINNGVTKQYYKLDKKIFRQPEGICFAPNGDMMISNEAGDATANIMMFRYNTGGSK